MADQRRMSHAGAVADDVEVQQRVPTAPAGDVHRGKPTPVREFAVNPKVVAHHRQVARAPRMVPHPGALHIEALTVEGYVAATAEVLFIVGMPEVAWAHIADTEGCPQRVMRQLDVESDMHSRGSWAVAQYVARDELSRTPVAGDVLLEWPWRLEGQAAANLVRGRPVAEAFGHRESVTRQVDGHRLTPERGVPRTAVGVREEADVAARAVCLDKEALRPARVALRRMGGVIGIGELVGSYAGGWRRGRRHSAALDCSGGSVDNAAFWRARRRSRDGPRSTASAVFRPGQPLM